MDGAGKDKSYAMCVTGPHRDAGMRSHSALMTRDSSEQTHDNIGGICNQKFPRSRGRCSLVLRNALRTELLAGRHRALLLAL